ncbi:P-type conjugative transfer protein TrbL [Desulfotalea psychrophila]|uniref:P-type conjugative transfer protein TrbL n=1 Tax=Desulfotalea psychrophila TaxID=84980 RepID=UPI00138A203C|nr:P-type conjugative transfer protein TrbL [Desulfotalea psychrophila]
MLTPTCVHATDINNSLINFIQQTVSIFATNAEIVGNRMEILALDIFQLLLLAEVIWLGLRMALKISDFKDTVIEFVKVLLVASLVLYIIKNHAEWINALSYGLTASYDGSLASSTSQSPETVVLNAIFIYIEALLNKLHITSPIDATFILLGVLVIAICAAFITVTIVCILIEAYFVLNISVILLGFGALKFTREFTWNYLKYILSVGLKLLTIKVLANFISSFFASAHNPLAVPAGDIGIQYMIHAIICMVVITGIFKTIPTTVASFVTNAGIGSNPIGAVVATVAGVAATGKMAGASSKKAGAVAAAAGMVSGGVGTAAMAAGKMAATATVGSKMAGAGQAAASLGKGINSAGQAAKTAGSITGSVLKGNAGEVKSKASEIINKMKK